MMWLIGSQNAFPVCERSRAQHVRCSTTWRRNRSKPVGYPVARHRRRDGAVVLTATEIAGFVGVGLAGGAYVPQIWHLVKAHCSAGLSRVAFATWWSASLLIMTRAIATRAIVFIILGAIQITATSIILVYTTKNKNLYCPTHLPRDLGAGTDLVPGSPEESSGPPDR